MFSEIFVDYLQNHNLTAYKVAKGTSIDAGTMEKYKNGIIAPTINNLIKIADFLNVSIDFLVGRTTNPDVNR